MKVTEEQRRALFDRVRAHLDEETATLLLEVTVPANVELATRSDIQELRAELLLRITELDGRLTGQIAELDRRLTGMITEVDGRLGGQIAELDRRLGGQIAELDRRLSGQIAALSKRVDAFETDLTKRLYFRIVPLIGGMIAIATWLGRL
jgi:hypothetical protein